MNIFILFKKKKSGERST